MKMLLVANTDWYLFNYRLSLGKFLRQLGYEVVMISPEGDYSGKLEAAGFRWLGWKVGRQSTALLDEMRALNNLRLLYRQEGPDLVHHFTMKPVLYGSIAARLAGIKGVVNSITGLGYIWLSNEPKARLLRALSKPIFQLGLSSRRMRMIFENEGDRSFFVNEGIVRQERVVVIGGVGVDVDYFSPQPENPGIPVILFPSRMLWDKGVGVVVEAARILRGKVKARVVLAGKPDPGNPTSIDETVIQQWVQEGLVEYWGWQEDMRKVYQQSHIVVLPSFYEGVSTALLEAAACAKPIVATDIPGCRAVVRHGENGFLVPVNDAHACAAALEKLVTEPELRKQMGRNGRKRILEDFTDQDVNIRTIAVYHTLLAGLEGV
jgi:glycosyltransferase involved in cell wall biosynthesis